MVDRCRLLLDALRKVTLSSYSPPYKAANMVELVNNIKNKPLRFPKDVNSISDVTEDILKRMLTVDPNKRIEWENLYHHPINSLLEDQIKKDL